MAKIKNATVLCKTCGAENHVGNKTCQQCGAKIKKERTFYKKWWFWVIVVFVGLSAIFGDYEDTPTKSSTNTSVSDQRQTGTQVPTQNPVKEEKAPDGIKPQEFENALKSAIKEIDTNGIIGRIEVTVTGGSAFVKMYLSNIAYWDASTETGQKEFINGMGTLANNIAASNIYEGTKTVGAEVKIYTPGGVELGTYTLFGNVKLK